MIGVQFHIEANAELIHAATYYETFHQSLGLRFVEAVSKSVEFIRSRSRAGVSIGKNIRRIVVREFPFNLIYHYDAQAVIILALAHQRRRPGCWKGRSK